MLFEAAYGYTNSKRYTNMLLHCHGHSSCSNFGNKLPTTTFRQQTTNYYISTTNYQLLYFDYKLASTIFRQQTTNYYMHLCALVHG